MSKRPVSKHTQEGARSRVAPTLAATLVGLVVGGWVVVHLADRAIAFGELALDGRAVAWLFAVAAGVGILACVLVVVLLVLRSLRLLGVIRDYKPRRAATRRR